jgi:hypothetical protein
LAERDVSAYLATARAKHPTQVRRNIAGPLTKADRGAGIWANQASKRVQERRRALLIELAPPRKEFDWPVIVMLPSPRAGHAMANVTSDGDASSEDRLKI